MLDKLEAGDQLVNLTLAGFIGFTVGVGLFTSDLLGSELLL